MVDRDINIPDNPSSDGDTKGNNKSNVQKRCGFVIRFLAYLIDFFILTCINSIVIAGTIGIILFQDRTNAIYAVDTVLIEVIIPKMILFLPLIYGTIICIKAVYFIFFIGSVGQTIGKMVMGIKVVSQQNGEPIGYNKACLRFVGYMASSVLFYSGFFWISVNSKKEGWHDKISESCVVLLCR